MVVSRLKQALYLFCVRYTEIKVLHYPLGVVASQLAKAGKSVLVVEKGAYHHEDEFIVDESKGFENLYEYGGFAPSYEGSITMLAGSVFGGGTTVNWCASLKVML